ncbi:MAG TPA: hypothetical protein VGF75_06310 [Candidatus Saccharimonadales bacterium]|jgi:hypothetical protein
MATSSTPNPVSDVIAWLTGNKGKTLEKMAIYVVGTLVATGVIPDSPDSKNWVVASLAAVLVGLHISTPTPKSGPSQL